MRGALLAIALVFATVPALAQPATPDPAASQPAAPQPPAPQPVVRATLTPAQVVVGQASTLVVEVLAPNYMTKPPVMPDFQIANAITRAASPMNFSERQGDASYAGIRYTFLLTPQEPGTYALAGQTITVTYADTPPHTRATTVPVPAVHFDAVIPDAARGLDPFISATHLSLSGDIQRSSPALKVGDSVTRIVTIEAKGAPAILLPPTSFAPIAGTRVYPGQPELSDGVDDGTGELIATRTDRAIYMLEEAGTLTLPAIEIAWWDAKGGTIQHARLGPQSFAVAGGTSAAAGGAQPGGLSAPRRLLLFVLEHWLALVAGIAAAAVLIRAAPPILRNLERRWRQRRDAYRRSEAFAFRELSRAAGRGDPRETYRAFLVWRSRFGPAAPTRTVKALNGWAQDPVLAQEIAALEGRLFAAGTDAGAWSGVPLIKAIRAIRSKKGAWHWNAPLAHSLPETINPESAEVARPLLSRPVAR